MSCIKEYNEIINYLISLKMPKKVLDMVCIKYYEFDEIVKVLSKIKSIYTILEVGSYVGVSTCLLSQFCQKIISIDPNLDIKADCDKYREKGEGKSREYFNKVMTNFKVNNVIKYDNYFSKVPNNDFIEFHKIYDENLQEIEILPHYCLNGESIDVVFLDGDHFKDGVLSDLMKIIDLPNLPKIIILHDVRGKWGNEICEAVRQFKKNNNYYSKLIKHGNIGFMKLRRKYGI